MSGGTSNVIAEELMNLIGVWLAWGSLSDYASRLECHMSGSLDMG